MRQAATGSGVEEREEEYPEVPDVDASDGGASPGDVDALAVGEQVDVEGADEAAVPGDPDGAVPLRAAGSPVYRPRLQRSRTRTAPSAAATAAGARELQDLEADLQIVFGPGDWGMELGALLRLPDGVDEVAVMDGGEPTWLGPLDDRLLEPLRLADAARSLDEGLVISGVGIPVRWRRSSRELHVFGEHTAVAGFVSRPRVAIGQENVVVCRDGLSDAALAQIRATGSGEPVRIEGPGALAGWTCWRGVRPARPSPPSSGPAILHALDPLPAVSIEMVGGLQLTRGRWLLGHPPSIRTLGLVEAGEPVLIDGVAAAADPEGGWNADGWDAAGRHRVEHGGLTAGYEIEPGAGTWDWWPAWRAGTSIVGALASADGGRWFHGSPAASLLGAQPHEICGFRRISAGVHMAEPDFVPVWMVTADGGLRRARASLVGEPLVPVAAGRGSPAAARWARSICSVRRADSADAAERRLWGRYVDAARVLRRRSR